MFFLKMKESKLGENNWERGRHNIQVTGRKKYREREAEALPSGWFRETSDRKQTWR